VLDRIENARRNLRPVMIPAAGFASVLRDREGQWGRFCQEVAGVAVRDYRPEKRLIILADEQGLRCHDGRQSPPRWTPVAASTAGGIGGALIARLTAMAPRWPAAATALVARDRDTVLVCRRHGPVAAGPVTRLASDVSPALVGAEVLAALAESRPEPGLPLDEALTEFRAALRDAGWTMGAFDAAPHADIARTTAGELIVTGPDGSRKERVEGTVAEAIGAAVLELLGPAGRIAAVPPDLRPAAFGPKTGWIAVHGSSADAVTVALGLRRTRPLAWDEGIEASCAQGVFVCPPVSGWVLAAGTDILLHDVDIAAISRRLGTQVQIFRTHRVPEHHEWALADGGTVLRSLRYVGESCEYQQSGEPTRIEHSLSLAGPDAVISEDDVFAVAGAWSLDPTRLGQHAAEAATGTWGRLR
jgi:hypothetical protein